MSVFLRNFLAQNGIKQNLGKSSFVVDRFGPLDANSGEVVLYDSTGEQTILDHLEFATDSETGVRLRIYRGGGLALATLRLNGSGREGFTPKLIVDAVSGYFDICDHNTSSNNYKYKLNLKELKLHSGLKITVENTSAASANCGVYAFGRVL